MIKQHTHSKYHIQQAYKILRILKNEKFLLSNQVNHLYFWKFLQEI